jgi:hypothetical protein
MNPVVYIRAADAGPFDVDDHIVRRLESRNRPVFVLDTSGLLKDEGEVLGTLDQFHGRHLDGWICCHARREL